LKGFLKNNSIKKVVFFSHLFLFILLFIALPSYPYYKFSPKVEQAYHDFLKLKVSSGETLINEAIKEEPQNSLAILISNYADFFKLMILQNTETYETLSSKQEERLTKLEEDEDKKSPYYLFAQAELRLQWGFIKIRYGDYMSGLWDVKEAYQLLKENNKKHPLFIPDKKSMGLLNILIGSVPQKYTTFLILAGIKGTHEKGAKLLKEASEIENPFQQEALIIRAAVDAFILNETNGKNTLLEKEYKTHPDNLLSIFVYATILHKYAKDEEALKVISSAPSSSEYITFPQIELLKADLLLNKLDFTDAREHYNSFLQKKTGLNYIKHTYYMLFLSYWLNNEDAQANSYLDKVVKEGVEEFDADKYAQKFAEKRNFPNKALMKARLLCDGGYYQQSLAILANFTPTTKADSIELNYRKARIYQGMEKYQEAITLHKQTIKQSIGINNYFAPNSCLQLGYIYRKLNNKESAKQYFLQALSYDDYEYKNSIETKAQAGLNELEKTQ